MEKNFPTGIVFRVEKDGKVLDRVYQFLGENKKERAEVLKKHSRSNTLKGFYSHWVVFCFRSSKKGSSRTLNIQGRPSFVRC